jgi:uncharacterized membrane protein YbhN (UPF0104 family)
MGLVKRTGSVWKRLLFLAIGVGAVAFLAHESGSTAVRASLIEAAAVIPLLVFLEGGRIGCEAISTRWIISGAGGTVPWIPLFRASLVSYSVCIITPIGRPVGETVRAAMVESFAGPDRAALAATTNQTLTLIANAVVAAVAAILVIVTKQHSVLIAAFVLYALAACGVALAIQMVARWRGFVCWLIARMRRYRRDIAGFYRSTKRTAYIPLYPTLIMIVGRLLQAMQFGVLCYALGLGFGLDTVLIGQGINLIGGAIGDWIPAQIGTIDGAFTVAASSLGIPQAAGLSIAVMVHCIQLFWVVIGALIPIISKDRQRSPKEIQIDAVPILSSSSRETN